MTILLLIRHASNDYIKEGRLAGWTPGVHINAQGQREADALAQRLAHLPIEAIYASPLERAVDTANAVAACHRLPVEIREGLGEGHVGEWTGKTIKELQETETWKAMQKNPVGVKPPGGESIDQVQARIVSEIDAIRRAHPKALIAIVSHADPLKAAISHYLAWDLNQFQKIALSPASASILVLDDEHSGLVLLNHTGDIPKFEKPKQEAANPEVASEGAQSSQPESRKDKIKMTEANLLYDLNPITRVMTGAVGEPGHRVFYLQARQGTTLVTLQAEKEQIASLSAGIKEMLERLSKRAGQTEPTSPYESALEEPTEPLFHIGQLGLGFDKEHDLLVIVAYEVAAEEAPEAVNYVRFWGTREQMRALAEHAAEVVAGGRPICVLCGKPIDPGGHFCPRRNGHGAKAPLV
jgi:uncharacterized repeat protein (TIGR03847 family)